MRGSNRPKRAKRFGFSLDSFGRNKLSRFAIFVSILAGSIGRAVYLNHRFKDKGLIGTKIKASNRVKNGTSEKIFTLKLSGNYLLEQWALVVAQLVERSLPITEVCSSNPAIGKIYVEKSLLST